MFPPIEPFRTGYLATTDGNEIYWEASGNPKGLPAIYIHGGPGGGIMTGYRRHFDPEKFCIVSFEQRGCGRSRPLATSSLEDLKTNTTQSLISDIELLRTHLNVDQWLLYGVSWGTTLALAYAQAHPDRVMGLILALICTTTHQEVEWITEDMRRIFPIEWERFAAMAEPEPGERIIDAYYRKITSPDLTMREAAAKAWCEWEDTHVSLDPRHTPFSKFQDPDFCMLFATLVIHYWKNGAFLGDQQILRNLKTIQHLPCVLIHGKLDVSSPLEIAWRLHKAWPGSELVILQNEGHGGSGMVEAVTKAVAKMESELVGKMSI
ncbi:prolyl aminopeptidase [Bdellovibrio svalbardensis]|uniref:Proline iminopeptidase n=1 Tax=Bdellovibrio svalbardensis TaxID=2972972 RepID=A0ABT6DG64_9BACT|nr:prolyl aminopeptidase [Bdellovibrio svalbardensis]MDG0815817.1 prolyl aminopeptidase [Bdellovibrio svalbardensis]